MSRAQEPHRPFPFGNPFRMFFPRTSHIPSKYLAVLNDFEQTLVDRLRKLVPKDEDDILSLSWMKSAMESLSETHRDIKSLVAKLDLAVIDWDERWIDVYLDISIKLLDVCIAMGSEVTRLNQGNILLQHVLLNLESAPSKQYVQACSSLDGWRQHINSRNPRVEKCCDILDSLVESLDLPKVKNSPRGKVLMRAMYGVKVETIFVCSVFIAGFSRSPKKLLDLSVSDMYLWAQEFASLQTFANGEIRKTFSSGRCTVLKEVESIDAIVKKMYPMIQDGSIDSVEGGTLENYVPELGRRAEKLSQGLDMLSREVDGFFQIVLTGRDALLSNLRDTGGELTPGKNAEAQLVK